MKAFKWLVIAVLILFLLTGTAMTIESYMKNQQNIKAMEYGYEQVIEDDKILWKPTNENNKRD